MCWSGRKLRRHIFSAVTERSVSRLAPAMAPGKAAILRPAGKKGCPDRPWGIGQRDVVRAMPVMALGKPPSCEPQAKKAVQHSPGQSAGPRAVVNRASNVVAEFGT